MTATSRRVEAPGTAGPSAMDAALFRVRDHRRQGRCKLECRPIGAKVPEPASRSFLPALMGSLHQQRAEGELALEHNDGLRLLYWRGGDLIDLHSEAVGEQFGSYLIRRGVLDTRGLHELLAEGEHTRVGDRVVQSGLLTAEERDAHLQDLFGTVLLHAMEHPILKVTWRPGPLRQNLSEDLHFWLNHRHLVWDTFHNARIDQAFVDSLRSEPDWRWAAKPDLLECLRDFPLTPDMAFALTLLGTGPLGYGTIEGVTGLGPRETARTVATLWALGGLRLVEGTLPLLPTQGRSVPVIPVRLPPEPKPEPEPETDITITLLDDDPDEPGEPDEPTLEVDAPDAPRAMNLMDFLELDAQAPLRDLPSPAGPAPASEIGEDSFFAASPRPSEAPAARPEPAGHPPAQPPPMRSGAPSIPAEPAPRPQAELPQVQRQASSPDQEPALSPPPPRVAAPYPPHALPLSLNDADLPPLERARHLIAKAKSYLSESRTSEATRALEQAILLDGTSPASFEALLLLGKLGATDPACATQAIEALRAASRIHPRAAQPWALMGEIFHRTGHWHNARGCFRRALELNPSLAVPREYQDLQQQAQPAKGQAQRESSLIERMKGMFGREKGSRG